MTRQQVLDLRRVHQSPLISVQFLNVPFDVVKGCFVSDDQDEDRACWEEECRGRKAKVFSDPINSALIACRSPSSGCTGPFYAFPDRSGSLCRHLATEESWNAAMSHVRHGKGRRDA
jgi:hypothetical protein